MADGVSLARAGVPDAPADYRVAIGGKNHVALQITNRQASTRTDSLTLINTAMAVAVAPGEVAWSTKANLQVVGRPLDKVVCTVPMTLEITGVESTGSIVATRGHAERSRADDYHAGLPAGV